MLTKFGIYMKHILLTLLATSLSVTSYCQDATVSVDIHHPQEKISKDIYGQFAEHLGSCIYGGLWVGPESPIPNIQGYRKDVFHALKELGVPVLRWPGGCFADEYHWMDGIGPRESRPTMSNNNWGGTVEDNSFGTHEFLNLCELLGCEPYISANIGSGSVEEMQRWVEYMTSDGDTPMARLRRKNGRDKAWKVRYFGIGNEAWGCGGNMRPEYYSDLFRRYATYCRNYDGNRLYKIASGANEKNINWTKTLMERIGNRMDACSVHFYTVTTWRGSKGSATDFNQDDYYWALARSIKMDDIIHAHDSVMSIHDPKKKIALCVDEWGTWWDVEPGTNPGHLYQQNTLRDAFVAALTLNIFHKHTDRVRMANIAQVVNVLQSMILTDQKGEGHLVLTPTYHIFRMYRPFQEAHALPVSVDCDVMTVRSDYTKPLSPDNSTTLPMLSCSAARQDDGNLVISLVNVGIEKAIDVAVDLADNTFRSVSGTILTARDITDYNDFSHPNTIAPEEFKDARLSKGRLRVSLPAKSVVVLKVK